jgi:bifunctional non-homologous end joining protein LigD
MVIRDKAGFVAAAQMGTIEFHIWGAQADDLERPDRVVFDLDPDEDLGFDAVKQAATELRGLLDELGLESVPMVTGGKGIHVIVPLRRGAGWETVKLFARTVASHFADQKPDRYVATMSKARRKGRVFIDWLRNERGATAVAPYSIRNRKGAAVAVPLDWAELDDVSTANSFSLADARNRLRSGCPLEAVSRTRTISNAVVSKLDKLTGE